MSDFIERHYDVGTVDDPAAFFRGSLPLRWGILGKQLVYFGGMTGKTVLGLTGSLEHVIGKAVAPEVRFPPRISSAPIGLLEVLRQEELCYPAFYAELSGDSQDLFDIAYAVRTIKGPEQKLEFLARRLMEGDEPTEDRDLFGGTRKRVLLGSPIYVAVAEYEVNP